MSGEPPDPRWAPPAAPPPRFASQQPAGAAPPQGDAPAWTPPPRVPETEVRPGRGWYVLAALLPVAGVAAAILVVVLAVSGATLSIDELRPSGGTIELEAGQERGLYGPQAVTLEGAPSGVFGPTCTVRGPDGGDVAVRGMGATSFTVNEWEAFGRFTPDSDGLHTVRCAEGSTRPLAVGPSPDVWGLLRSIGLAFALGAVGVLAGIAVALVVFFRRRNERRRRQAALVA